MKKDILFLCQFFYPEHNSSATLPFDTAKHLASLGYSVDALCGYPKEYSDEKGIPLKENKDGVNIKRLRYIQFSRVGKIGRLINYFSFTLAVLLRIFTLKNYRSVVVYSNPPVLPLAPVLANKLFKTKIVFVAYDIYPEVAYSSASLSEGGLIDVVMKRINSSLYKNASAVVALTEEMKDFILKNRPQAEDKRVFVIPNWAHESERKADKKDYEKFGFENGELVVSYFGNMGICQDVETMLYAIKRLKDDDGVRFLIVGHGNKKAYVEQQTADIQSVRVYGFLTDEDFKAAAAVASCGIVSLEKGLMGTCAPSKYYSYLQSGCAILSVVEKDSYIAKEVSVEKIGISVEIGDGEALVKAIRFLKSNRDICEAMGNRAAALYNIEYSKNIAMEKYSDLFGKLL